MNAWHKALKNVMPTVTRTWAVACRNWPQGCRRNHRTETREIESSPTRSWVVNEVKSWGWTYTKDGEWLCPKCSKEGA